MKKDYVTPEIIVHGTIGDITQGPVFVLPDGRHGVPWHHHRPIGTPGGPGSRYGDGEYTGS
jgi:hypothetical protein